MWFSKLVDTLKNPIDYIITCNENRINKILEKLI